jgi:16S rRNA (uracil1498-N3)-methyltransferase
MSLARFFHPEAPLPGDEVELDPGEARHAAGSRRLRVDDPCELFDGRGIVVHARVSAMQRGRPRLRVESRSEEPPPSPLWLACALPKGDRQATLVDMATQVGMTRLLPVCCERSVVQPSPKALERLRRVVVEACKQSRRAWLPVIDGVVTLDAALAMAGNDRLTIAIAHPGREQGQGDAGSITADRTDAPGHAILVGPEGGFTEAEIQRARVAGARPVSLEGGVLRVETAAVALLSLARWGC